MATALQSRMSEVLAVDIHPAARLGRGILLDHGTGVVIGETAVIGNNVSLLQVGQGRLFVFRGEDICVRERRYLFEGEEVSVLRGGDICLVGRRG